MTSGTTTVKYAARMFANMLGYAQRLTADLTDDDLQKRPFEGMNPPAWILGHLVLVADGAVMLLGGEGTCPPEWRPWFGKDSIPLAAGAPQSTKAELMAMLAARHAEVDRLLAKGVTQARLDEPNPREHLRATLPTVGDFLTHMLTTHPATHLGQLSAWRRAIGKPAV